MPDGRRGKDLRSLEDLLAPMPVAQFIEHSWEREPVVLQRGQPDFFAGLLSVAAIEELIATRGVTPAELRLVNAVREIKDSDYASEGRFDPARVLQLLAEGTTVILNQQQERIPALRAMCEHLAGEFSAPLQANVYLTPPDAKGFDIHFDSHDVFILQVEGSKQWRLYDSPVLLPLRGEAYDPETHRPGVPLQEFDLLPGDIAYIPRGVMHDARSSDRTSLHVTVGILSRTWAEVVLGAVAEACKAQPEFRRSLPFGFARPGSDRAATVARLEGLLQRLSGSIGADGVIQGWIEEFALGRVPALPGQAGQLRRLDSLMADSRVCLRPNVSYAMRIDGAYLLVLSSGKEIALPRVAETLVRAALQGEPIRVGDLATDLDEDSAHVVVRRLIKEGILAFC